jgi:hypothetical protein
VTPPPAPRATRPPVEPGSSKFAPYAPDPTPDNLPRPDPPLPVPAIPVVPSADAGTPTGPRPEFTVKLPEPPAEVPHLREDLPTPPVWDDIPVIPPSHTSPMPLPANLPSRQ